MELWKKGVARFWPVDFEVAHDEHNQPEAVLLRLSRNHNLGGPFIIAIDCVSIQSSM
jgi:hypothetical protein